MKQTRVLLVEDDTLVSTTVRLALESLGYTIVGAAVDRSEVLRMLTERTPDLVMISPSVLEKTGRGLVREVVAKQHVSVLVTPGYPQGQFVRALSLLQSWGIRDWSNGGTTRSVRARALFVTAC